MEDVSAVIKQDEMEVHHLPPSVSRRAGMTICKAS